MRGLIALAMGLGLAGAAVAQPAPWLAMTLPSIRRLGIDAQTAHLCSAISLSSYIKVSVKVTDALFPFGPNAVADGLESFNAGTSAASTLVALDPQATCGAVQIQTVQRLKAVAAGKRAILPWP